MFHPSADRKPSRLPHLIWELTILLVTIGLLAVVRRTYVLLFPPQGTPRFAAAAAMDAGFAQHRAMTLLHILPASLFMALMPLQFVRRITAANIRGVRPLLSFAFTSAPLASNPLTASVSPSSDARIRSV
jgi:hypothetical protein